MLQGWVVIAVALGYIGLLFLVASYGDRTRGLGRDGRAAAADLSAVAGDLLHVLDLLRLGRLGLAHRLRIPHHLYRPGADDRPVLAADRAHRAARQGAEHHLDRRLHRRALRQEPGGRGDRGADRHHRHDPLHRAAAQGGVGLARDHPRRMLAPAAAGTEPLLGDIALFVALLDGDLRGAVRHPPHRRHRAPGRPDAGDRDRIDRQAVRLPRGRHLRHVLDVRRARRAVRGGATQQPDDRRDFHARAARSTRCVATTLLSFFAILLLPRQFHVAVVENNNEQRDQARAPGCFRSIWC